MVSGQVADDAWRRRLPVPRNQSWPGPGPLIELLFAFLEGVAGWRAKIQVCDRDP